jgi:hypothetical protein
MTRTGIRIRSAATKEKPIIIDISLKTIKSEYPKTPSAAIERIPPDGRIISAMITTTPTSCRMIGRSKLSFIFRFP